MSMLLSYVYEKSNCYCQLSFIFISFQDSTDRILKCVRFTHAQWRRITFKFLFPSFSLISVGNCFILLITAIYFQFDIVILLSSISFILHVMVIQCGYICPLLSTLLLIHNNVSYHKLWFNESRI